MNTGCLILAGGKSRRMGYRKSSLRLNGTTFLDKLIFELRDFPEILVSVDDAARHPEIPYSMIVDRYSDCGPMSGLYSALSVCESYALLVLPCDVPLFSGTLAHHLQEVMEHSDTAAIIKCIFFYIFKSIRKLYGFHRTAIKKTALLNSIYTAFNDCRF